MDGPQDRTEYNNDSSGKIRVASGGLLGALVYFVGSSFLGIPLAPALVGGLTAGVLAKKQAYVLLVGFPLVFMVMLHSLVVLSGGVFLVGKIVGTFLNITLMGIGVLIGATLADDEEESEALPDYRMLK